MPSLCLTVEEKMWRIFMGKITEEEISKITAYANEIGLDKRIAMHCKNKNHVDELYKIQVYENEHSHGYIYRMQTSPKEKTKEYEAVIKHRNALYDYLTIGGHYEEARALSEIKIPINVSKVKDYEKNKKEYFLENLEKLFFNKTAQEDIAKILVEYATAKHNPDAGNPNLHFTSSQFTKIQKDEIPLIDGTKRYK